ncbi:MAG: phosphoribosyl-ATP diphosphatase [Inquilinaceae bacterium]
MTADAAVLGRLYDLIASRRGADPEISHTALLFARGRARMAQKVGEEATETVIAAMQDDATAVAQESADLMYHLLVLWADTGVRPDDVWAVLEAREGTSGVDEKKARPKR